MTARACAFITHAGFAIIGRLAISVFNLGAETGSHLRITARIVRHSGASSRQLPFATPGWLHVHRHLHGRSFQSTRAVRLVLTHQLIPKRRN
jgi:hypothetical protein